MAESSNPKAFRVAIVGGGIGGLALALGLFKYDHIDVQIYEAAHSFGEIGAGVAIGPNSQRALKLIAPHAWDAFKKHATPNMWESYADTFTRHIVVSDCHLRMGIWLLVLKMLILSFSTRAKASTKAK